MADTIDILIRTGADLKGIQQVQQAITAITKGGAAGSSAAKPFADAGVAAAKAERDILRYASSLAAAQKAQGDLAGAVGTWKQALAQITPNTIEANRATAALAQSQTALQKELSGSSSIAEQFGASLKNSLTSAIGPAAAAAIAFKATTDVVQSLADAIKFKADLDATTASINIQLKGVRDAGETWASASIYANKYKLTQEQVNEAIVAAMPVIRNSKASMEDILGTFDRLKLRDPAKTFSDAARALSELQAGQTMSLVRLFNVPLADANKMKHEIEGGADAVRVLSRYLSDAGISMDALAAKTTGAKGRLLELAQEQERLKIAQAEFAEGPGMTILEGQIRTTSGATRVLSGDWQSMRASVLETINSGVEGMSTWNPIAAAFAGIIGQATGATQAHAAATQQSTNATTQNAAASGQGAAATQQLAAAHLIAADADERRTAAALTAAQVTQDEANASLMDKAAKEVQTAQTELLNFQTRQAADAFLALNPNISQSGVASAVAAGQISVAVGQYISMTLAAARARAELANLQAQAGISPALKAAAAAVGGGGDVARYITRPADAGAKADADAKVARLKELEKQDRDRAAAARELELAKSTAAQKATILKKEADDAARMYGAGSTQALKAQTALVNAQQSAEKAGHKGRADAAQVAADTLEKIEQKTSDRIAEIAEDAQKKITAIDEREAERQRAAVQKLNDDIAGMTADRRAQDEADDLDLIGVKDKNRARELNNREKAEATARASEKRAAEEAKRLAESGAGEAANKVLDIREKQIGQQQALDEAYYKRQAELAGDPEALAALQTQYEEGTRAYAEQAELRIDIAKRENEEHRLAVEDEKNAVVATAQEQTAKVIQQAQASAEGIKRATDAAKTAAVSDLKAIGAAVDAIPTSKTITISVKQEGSTTGTGSAGGSTKSAGGGSFLTNGPTTITVGDNPGGVEAVHVMPISGTGTTTVGAGMTRLAGGGTVLIDAGNGYTTPIAGTGGGGKGKSGKAGAPKPVDMEQATKMLNQQIAYYKAVAELANLVASPLPALNTDAIQRLADDSKRIGAVVGSVLVPVSKDNSTKLDAYEKAVSGSINILKDVADLRKDLGEPQPPLDPAYIRALAADTRTIGAAVGGVLVPIAYSSMIQLENYEKAVGSSVSILKNVADLRKDLTEPYSPLDQNTVYKLAIDAQRAEVTVRSLLIPVTEQQADDLDRYEKAVGSSVGVLKDVSELSGKLFTDYQSPTDAQITMLAKDADRVAKGFIAAATTYDTKALEAAKLYNDAVGGTFSNIKDGLLAMQALSSGDFTLDPANLAKFERSSATMMDTVQRLGSRAATIPATDIAALQTVTAAISAQAEALIRMAAVPFGNLPQTAGAFSQQGGGVLGGMTMYNTFVLPQGTTQQLAQEVIRILNTQTYTRR